MIHNVELSTGKRLQPFYAPVDLDRVDHLSRSRIQINGNVREMSKITANNKEVLEIISTTQHLVSSEVAKAQKNLLETFDILKKILSK